ncbi:TetR/AcrR family transcriptional regulator [Sporosarcina sp. FSL W7-1349]|uniref:TetR/AcrR family transcriptional regulator n=1 Tax=Bacillales TaxID=1385 RepID=UPI000581BB30|nr:TetR/AcrR family transcriptional regulator [Bacillus sp. OxB-1]BAQ09071.1 transcriptional regulator [Bacillus sp. OxB-1]
MKKNDKYYSILEAAKKVFAQEGYHGASISKIAKEADIGDGTVYLYFKNKEDILIQLFDTAIYHRHVPKSESLIEPLQDPRIMLYELIRNHFDFFGEDYDMAKVVQIESRQPTESSRSVVKKGTKRYFQLLRKIIEKGQEEGLFRTDVSTSSLQILIFGTLDEFVTAWVLSEHKYSLMRKVEDAYKMLLQSIYNFSNNEREQWLASPRKN